MSFKITLRACRVNLGLTLKEASKKFNIHHETLSNYENDSTNIPRTFFVKIESVYGIPVDYIYFGDRMDYIFTMRNNPKLMQHA